jgi:hypothetical protein
LFSESGEDLVAVGWWSHFEWQCSAARVGDVGVEWMANYAPASLITNCNGSAFPLEIWQRSEVSGLIDERRQVQFPFVPADAETSIVVVLHFPTTLPRNDVKSMFVCSYTTKVTLNRIATLR